MDAQMQQGESSSDEMYEEVEEVVRTICGQNVGHKVNKLRSYRRKFKKLQDQYQTSMKLVHHWKDKCLDTKAKLSQSEEDHKPLRAELLELQIEHDKLGKWLSQSTDPYQKPEDLKISKLKSQSLRSQESESLRSHSCRRQSELSDEPQFKRSKVAKQPKDPPPAHVFPIGATLPKKKVKAPMFDEPWHEGKF